MPGNSLAVFIRLLKNSPSGPVFNPWWEADLGNDIGLIAPRIRRAQLHAYLNDRLGQTRLLLIGEALGYRGGHFSGIPMTSERVLLGENTQIVRRAGRFFSAIHPHRTSRPDKYRHLFSEPTATIVWSRLLEAGIGPREFVLWNAFPWHSFDPRVGFLSNRTPNRAEQSAGLPLLERFVRLFPCRQVIALGKIAQRQLDQLHIAAPCVRHPASGGAKIFAEEIGRIVREVSLA